MAKEKIPSPEYAGNHGTATIPDVMTVDDFARDTNMGPVMLAGFKSFLKERSGVRWRTREDWERNFSEFANAPA